MELGLKNRRVLITGGSEGIGFAVAKAFLAEGAEVVIASRSQEKLDRAVSELSQVSKSIRAHAVDLSVQGAAEKLADAYPDTDILVNNAGAIPIGDIFEVDEKRWRESWDLKVFGYINLTRAMYRHMKGEPPVSNKGPMPSRNPKESNEGEMPPRSSPKVIMNVIGTGAEKPMWRYVCGNASNIALNGVTYSLGGRSLDDGIRVLAVNPGAVETERWRAIHKRRAQEILGDPERWREVLHDQPQRRAATSEEVADVTVFLCSDRASWVCGEVVNIDGGRLHREAWF